MRFRSVLIERSDVADGAFDIEFNYAKIQWDASGYGGGKLFGWRRPWVGERTPPGNRRVPGTTVSRLVVTRVPQTPPVQSGGNGPARAGYYLGPDYALELPGFRDEWRVP